MKTYEEAFKGHDEWLTKKLEVSSRLLNKLKDKGIVTEEHVEEIGNVLSSAKKVTMLLRVLERRDDASFPDFCEILKAVEQQHVVAKICPELTPSSKDDLEPNAKRRRVDPEQIAEKMKAELTEILEPDYGLPQQLSYEGLIKSCHVDMVREGKTVTTRVKALIQAVEEKVSSVTNDKFLTVLREDRQSHVVNFIETNGNIDLIKSDERPLSEQQRRRLLDHRSLVTEMNSLDTVFQYLLLDKNVISELQLEDVNVPKSRQKGNELLLRILKRRSLGDVKEFIKCLCEVGQIGINIAKQLIDAGAIVRIVTTIVDPVSVELKLNKEGLVAENFAKSCDCRMILETYELLCKQGCDVKITCVELIENSLAWYLLSRTLRSLDNLKSFYDSSRHRLAEMLSAVFNSLDTSKDSDAVQLHVEWPDEDYEQCKELFIQKQGRPFRSDNEHCRSLDQEVIIFTSKQI
jgi:hypothetical protein